MDLKRSLAGQFRAGLAMLRECVELCPSELWSQTMEAPPRNFWRVVYHAAFYTHFYLSPQHDQFTPWSKHVNHAVMTFAEDGEKLPPEGTVYSPSDLLEYIDFISENIDAGNQLASPPTIDSSPSPYGVWGAYGTIRGGETISE